ncbi:MULTISPECIES: D-alanine--D-alanine ligase family protein [unclassified Pseudomonas]|uniref:D-alanine--D-alanine ligase family protein n=1 Tax=unclassified Pseudomonas TaxID=196821 RepID=UPI0030DCF897
MPRENIAIVTGGDSSEREVSLETCDYVSRTLHQMNIDCSTFIISSYKDFIALPFSDFTRVFLALHGGFGENGMAQAYLRGLGIPHNGPSPQASAICMDKLLTKHIAKGLGIKVPDYLFFPNDQPIFFELAKRRFGSRFIVKPNGGGCSIGVSLINDEAQFDQAVKLASSYQQGILLEEFISGQELSVSYFYGGMLPTLAVGFTTDFFSYEAKFESNETKSWFIELTEPLQRKIDSDGVIFAKSLGLDYYRADVIINNETPYLIEINTLPGLTSHSLFPKACARNNIAPQELISKLNNLNFCTTICPHTGS